MTSVRVYTTRLCGYCVAAKRHLERKGVRYEEIDVSDDPEKRMWLVEATGRRTVPQIFIGEQAIGGYTDLVDLDKRGQLDPMLRG